MSIVPGEVLRDVLQPLDRWTLDGVQFTNRRFLQVILVHMSDVCLRQVITAVFQAPDEHERPKKSSYTIRIDGRPEVSYAHHDTSRLFFEFVRALRSSRVAHLDLNRVFTPALVGHVLEMPISVRKLDLGAGSCAGLTPAQFHDLVLHLSPDFLLLGCHLRAGHVTDGLLRALSNNRVRGITLLNNAPVDGGSFGVTDDAVVDFCVQPNDCDAEGRQLVLYNGSFTKDLFKRLVEAIAVSTHTQPLHITVSPVPFQDEDLRDFAQHLSDHYRDPLLRVYDFPDEQRGVDDPMHLQIVLRPNNRLDLIRAQRPNRFFYP
ncbi:hypothetical protein AAVH_31307 [Aphelenchoides avenae]|nr:hypothetical protein AAVH_31307 [Aphelenchus avenae]